MVQRIKNQILCLQLICLVGCASQPIYTGIDYPTQSPNYTPTQPPLINYNTIPLQQALQNSQLEASRLQQFANLSSNRNELSQALINFQNANRNLNAVLQNPWNGFFLLRNY